MVDLCVISILKNLKEANEGMKYRHGTITDYTLEKRNIL